MHHTVNLEKFAGRINKAPVSADGIKCDMKKAPSLCNPAKVVRKLTAADRKKYRWAPQDVK